MTRLSSLSKSDLIRKVGSRREVRYGREVRYLEETSFLELTHGGVYEVMSIEKDWRRIVDGSGEGYLYSSEDFEAVEPNDGGAPVGDW